MTERINKKILALHFSNRAETYDRAAQLQREIAYQLVERSFPEPPPTACDILELGCGTGFLTRFLLERLAPRSLVALDLAPGMIERARESLNGSRAAVRFLLADCERPPLAPGSFDLAASSTTLQWLDSLEDTLRGVHALLRPGGRLVFATLGQETFRELRRAYRTAAGQMGIRLAAGRYGPSLPGAHEVRRTLMSAGFENIVVDSVRKMEFFPCCRDFLRSIKERGANNPNFRPMSLAVERTLMRRVIEYYDRSFNVDGRVYAGYEVIFAEALKDGGETK